ncbi:unnamed protein product, partial [Rotaria sp. Silwood2]
MLCSSLCGIKITTTAIRH